MLNLSHSGDTKDYVNQVTHDTITVCGISVTNMIAGSLILKAIYAYLVSLLDWALKVHQSPSKKHKTNKSKKCKKQLIDDNDDGNGVA